MNCAVIHGTTRAGDHVAGRHSEEGPVLPVLILVLRVFHAAIQNHTGALDELLLHVRRVLRAGKADGDEVGLVLAAVDRNIEQNAADLPVLIGFDFRIAGQVAGHGKRVQICHCYLPPKILCFLFLYVKRAAPLIAKRSALITGCESKSDAVKSMLYPYIKSFAQKRKGF